MRTMGVQETKTKRATKFTTVKRRVVQGREGKDNIEHENTAARSVANMIENIGSLANIAISKCSICNTHAPSYPSVCLQLHSLQTHSVSYSITPLFISLSPQPQGMTTIFLLPCPPRSPSPTTPLYVCLLRVAIQPAWSLPLSLSL